MAARRRLFLVDKHFPSQASKFPPGDANKHFGQLKAAFWQQ
jgi:hypothetical protein